MNQSSQSPLGISMSLGDAGLQFVTGFNPVTAATLAWRLTHMGLARLRRRSSQWLDWELAEWPLIYSADLTRTASIELPALGRRPVRIPYVVEITNAVEGRPLTDFGVVRSEAFSPDSALTAPRDGVVAYYEKLKRGFARTPVSLFDGRCTRLSGYQHDTRTFQFGSVSYYDALRTNLAMDARDDHGATLRERLHREALEPVGGSSLADPLGVNVLLVCEGGYLVVLERSLSTLVRPRELCPSGSGTVSPGDICGPSLADVTVLREVAEELGAEVAAACTDVTFLGLARDLVRGGLPDLFFVASCALTREEITALWNSARDRAESAGVHFFHVGPYHRGHVTQADDFAAVLASAITHMGKVGRVSATLWTQLALWFQWRLNGHG